LPAEIGTTMAFDFSLPYTAGINTVIEELDVSSISDIYFSDNKFGSARTIFNGKSMYDELYSLRGKYGIKLHYLINPSIYSNEFYKDVNKMIDYIAEIDADMVTLNNTYLLRAGIIQDLKKNKPGIVLKNSVNNLVRTQKDFIFMHEVLGLTHIIVDRSLNRDLDTLGKMSKYAEANGIKITMLVNEGCIVDCKWKQWDDLIISQHTEDSDRDLTDKVHTELGCVRYFKHEPSEWLKTAFTLPNNLSKFEGMVDVIKLAGRGYPIDRWFKVVNAYQKRSGNIQFGDILSTTGDLFLANLLVNQITEAGFTDITHNCKTVCGDECNHCDKIYTKLKRNFV